MHKVERDDWRLMPFSEAVEINPRRPLAKSGKVPFLDMSSLPLNGFPVSVTEEREVASGGSRFGVGDTLFARITPCTENGKLGFVQSIAGSSVAQGSTEFIVMSAREGVSLPEYVRFLAGWSEVRCQAIDLMEGTSGRQRVPSWAFEEIEVPMPPLDEQLRIAAVLRSVDEVIATTTEAVSQASRSLDQSRAALTGLDGSRPNWQRGRLLDFFQLQRGHDLPVQNRVAGSVPVIASNGWVGTHDKAAILAPAVVTGRSGTIGKVTYFDGPCWPLNTTLFVRDFKGANPRYVFHFLSAFPLTDYQSGTGVPTLNRNDVHAVEVAWPSVEEQKGIATSLDALERSVVTMKAALAQARTLKAQLGNDLLSGRVRVPS
jgi:type I restriction enzyme S subunit